MSTISEAAQCCAEKICDEYFSDNVVFTPNVIQPYIEDLLREQLEPYRCALRAISVRRSNPNAVSEIAELQLGGKDWSEV